MANSDNIITTNGFFGTIEGPFNAEEEILIKIQNQCNKTVNYLSKLGIHYVGDYDLDLKGQLVEVKIIDEIPGDNDNEQSTIMETIFQIGKTRMLEFEDVHITSIKFIKDTNNKIYLDYQYK